MRRLSLKSTDFGVDPTFVAEWWLQFSCTSGVLGLLLTPNNQLVANRGVVS